MATRRNGALAAFLARFLTGPRFDATRFAHELDWSQIELGIYLKKSPQAISKTPTLAASQDQLARLAALVEHAFDLNGGDMALTAAWLRTPERALKNRSPKQLILAGEIEAVEGLLEELDVEVLAS